MKVCPLCRSKYTDDTLAFCLQDGSPLVDESTESSGEPTAVLHDAETIASGRESGRIDVEVTREDDERETQERIPGTLSHREPARRQGTLRTVIATVVVMLLIFGVLGSIGVIYYLSGSGSRTAVNDGANTVAGSNGDKGIQLGRTPVLPTPSPSATASVSVTPTPSPTSTPAPSPTIDEAELKGAVGRRLAAWKTFTESKDLNSLMSCYAENLKYYFRRAATSKSFVRRNKASALARFRRISITISNVNISIGPNGQTATAVFDKEWRFEGAEKVSTGKVRSQFGFVRVGDEWLINGEKDLRVYYTRSL